MGVTHARTATGTPLIGATDWNDAHTVSLTAADVGADASGAAAAAQSAAESTASGALTTHAGAADPHTGYRLETADHNHSSTGLQGGTVAYSAITGTPVVSMYVQAGDPGAVGAGVFWLDTTGDLSVRNSADSAWIAIVRTG